MVDGELVVNPTLEATEESELDLDRRRHEGRADDGRGRRRRRCPRRRCSRRSSSRTARSSSSARRRRSSATGRQAEVARPRAHGRARRAARRAHRGRHRRTRPAGRRRRSSRTLEGELCPELTMASTEEDIIRRDAGAREPRAAAREAPPRPPSIGPVREQFMARPRGAHRRRAGLEGAQVGEAPAALRPHRRGRAAAVPGRPGAGRGRGCRRRRTR